MGKLQLGGAKDLPLQERANGGMIEDRGVDYIQGPDGKMQGSRPSGRGRVAKGEPKYAPSPQRNSGGIKVSPAKYNGICSLVMQKYGNLPKGAKARVWDNKNVFHITADGDCGVTVDKIIPLRSRR